jgi:hypothetical protein
MTAIFLFTLFLKAMGNEFTKWYEKNKIYILLIAVIVMVTDGICLFNYFKILYNGTY